MKLRQLRALIWKDMRLNRLILILSGAMVLLAYLSSLGVEIYRRQPGEGGFDLLRVIGMSAPIVICFTALCTALLGANVVAGEYGERSAVFLAYQPPSRQLVVLSKVITGFVPSLALAAIALATLALSFDGYAHGGADFWNSVGILLSGFWLIFAASWCIGAVSRSTAIGVGGGVFLPLALAIAGSNRPLVSFSMAATVIGTVLFAGSTTVLLRRSES